jgi:hypothetical protein
VQKIISGMEIKQVYFAKQDFFHKTKGMMSYIFHAEGTQAIIPHLR